MHIDLYKYTTFMHDNCSLLKKCLSKHPKVGKVFDIIDKESYDKILTRSIHTNSEMANWKNWNYWSFSDLYHILETDNPTIFKSKRIKDCTLNRGYNYIHIVLRKIIIVNRYRCLWTNFCSHVHDEFLPSFNSQFIWTKLNVKACIT